MAKNQGIFQMSSMVNKIYDQAIFLFQNYILYTPLIKAIRSEKRISFSESYSENRPAQEIFERLKFLVH